GHWVDLRMRAKHQKELEEFLFITSKPKEVVRDKSKSVRSLLKESKYSNKSVKPNLSGNDNSLFEDDIVADLNETELE
ncbi:3871_t:CDS:1, partial [Racocetra persica]